VGSNVLSYTGKLGSDLTGVSGGEVGTTDANSTSGDTAINVMRVKGTPANLVRWLLLSRDSGSGTYDIMPGTWAYALAKRFVAVSDISDQQAQHLAVASGTNQWTLWSEAPVDSGISFIQDALNPGGVFLCQRQGQITMRTARKQPTNAKTSKTITDSDIASIEGWDMWTSSAEAEYRTVTLTTGSGSTSATGSTVTTRPAAEVDSRDGSTYVWGNESAIGTTHTNNLKTWSTTVGAELILVLHGLHWAQVTTGDIVGITSDFLWVPDTVRVSGSGEADATRSLTERRAMVQGIQPLWGSGQTQIRLLIPPR